MDYNAQKAVFHSGNAGGSLTQLHLVTLAGTTTHYAWTALSLRTRRTENALVVEYLIFVAPLILVTTVLSRHLFLVNILIAGIAYYRKSWRSRAASTPSEPRTQRLPSPPPRPLTPDHVVLSPSDKSPDRPRQSTPRPAAHFNQPFVTVYRAQMMLITIVCILAVDFPAFPRTFGKCETYGTSLMDLGVGSFVFTQGLISALPLLRERTRLPFPVRMRKATKRSAGVLALGLVRVLAVKGVDYPEQVQEYGVHWNFFFTLGLMPLIGVLCETAWPAVPFWALGLGISAAHQAALTSGLTDWVLHAPRQDLITANKEGIVSFSGYVAIFLLGIDTGLFVLPPDPYFAYRDDERKEGKALKPKLGKLASVLAASSLAWWMGYGVLRHGFSMGVSRQMANLPYVVWIAAFNTAFLLGGLTVQMNDVATQPPALLDAINRNGLVIFLLANVLTGSVNLSLRTIETRDAIAVVVVLLYSAVVCTFAWSIRHRRLRF